MSLYVDTSGSMNGYIRGATRDAAPLADFITSISDQFAADGLAIAFKPFAIEVRSLPANQRQQLLSPAFYGCAGRPSPCPNAETRLDRVMADVAAAPDDLAVIVSDMWFDDPQSATTGLVPLAGPLRDILRSGRSIAIYGIKAPFNGNIFEPGQPTRPFAGEHPLILMAIGNAAQIERFHHHLAHSPSRFLAEGVTRGTHPHTLFTLDPRLPARPDREPFAGMSDPRVKGTTVLDAIEGVSIRQFEISTEEVAQDAARTAGLSWNGPDPASLRPASAWAGPTQGRTRIWERVGTSCQAEDWQLAGDTAVGWSAVPEGGRYTFDPVRFSEDYPAPQTYLVAAELFRTQLGQPNPAAIWLRDWSYGSGGNEPVSTDGRFHRTLHLSELARYLENALIDAADGRPIALGGVGFVVRVVD